MQLLTLQTTTGEASATRASLGMSDTQPSSTFDDDVDDPVDESESDFDEARPVLKFVVAFLPCRHGMIMSAQHHRRPQEGYYPDEGQRSL
jgi:hypothetical protein